MTVSDRELTAGRLLSGSVKRSYDPEVDIDWDAPLSDGKFFAPPSMLTLYGTPLWDTLGHEQRVELSRQELVNALSVGIWFENILNQLLLRMAYRQNPTRAHVHYALTELGDDGRVSSSTTSAACSRSSCVAPRSGWPPWSVRRSSTRCSAPPCTTSRYNRWCAR